MFGWTTGCPQKLEHGKCLSEAWCARVLSRVCYNRAEFSDTVWTFAGEEATVSFKFMFVFQNPLFIAFSKVEPQEVYVDVETVTSEHFNDVEPPTLQKWELDWFSYVPWHKVPRVPEADIRLSRDVQYFGGKELRTHDAGIPFADFLARLPPRAATRETDKHADLTARAARVDWRTEVLRRFPWLAGSFEEDDAAEKAAKQKGRGSAREDESLWDLDDDEVEDVFEELRNMRAELAANGDAVQQADFHWDLLGGGWTARNKGKVFDAVSCSSRAGSDQEIFCEVYHIGKTARFDITAYELQGCIIMANFWCFRAQYHWSIYDKHRKGEPNYIFTAEDVAGLKVPQAYRDLGALLRTVPHARWKKILDYVPQR